MQVLPAGCIDPRYPSGCCHPHLRCQLPKKHPMMGVDSKRSTHHTHTHTLHTCVELMNATKHPGDPTIATCICSVTHRAQLLSASGTTHAGVSCQPCTSSTVVPGRAMLWCGWQPIALWVPQPTADARCRHEDFALPAHTPDSERNRRTQSHHAVLPQAAAAAASAAYSAAPGHACKPTL